MKLKVHHQLLAMGLSPNELKVYCYLMSCATDGIAIVRAGRIAERCQISRATVQTACTSMAAKGVLSKVNRYADGHLVANAYHLSTFTGRFFMLDADAAVFGFCAGSAANAPPEHSRQADAPSASTLFFIFLSISIAPSKRICLFSLPRIIALSDDKCKRF